VVVVAQHELLPQLDEHIVFLNAMNRCQLHTVEDKNQDQRVQLLDLYIVY
jgi:hypothetical protein